MSNYQMVHILVLENLKLTINISIAIVDIILYCHIIQNQFTYATQDPILPSPSSWWATACPHHNKHISMLSCKS